MPHLIFVELLKCLGLHLLDRVDFSCRYVLRLVDLGVLLAYKKDEEVVGWLPEPSRSIFLKSCFLNIFDSS